MSLKTNGDHHDSKLESRLNGIHDDRALDSIVSNVLMFHRLMENADRLSCNGSIPHLTGSEFGGLPRPSDMRMCNIYTDNQDWFDVASRYASCDMRLIFGRDNVEHVFRNCGQSESMLFASPMAISCDPICDFGRLCRESYRIGANEEKYLSKLLILSGCTPSDENDSLMIPSDDFIVLMRDAGDGCVARLFDGYVYLNFSLHYYDVYNGDKGFEVINRCIAECILEHDYTGLVWLGELMGTMHMLQDYDVTAPLMQKIAESGSDALRTWSQCNLPFNVWLTKHMNSD